MALIVGLFPALGTPQCPPFLRIPLRRPNASFKQGLSVVRSRCKTVARLFMKRCTALINALGCPVPSASACRGDMLPARRSIACRRDGAPRWTRETDMGGLPAGNSSFATAADVRAASFLKAVGLPPPPCLKRLQTGTSLHDRRRCGTQRSWVNVRDWR